MYGAITEVMQSNMHIDGLMVEIRRIWILKILEETARILHRNAFLQAAGL